MEVLQNCTGLKLLTKLDMTNSTQMKETISTEQYGIFYCIVISDNNNNGKKKCNILQHFNVNCFATYNIMAV